jgi:signal transduction histidine kinase/ligand-binding sensor domain-containing protein
MRYLSNVTPTFPWNRLEVLLSIALALAVSTSAFSQTLSTEPPITDYTVTSWSDANGLRLGAIYSIVQDADGYLWIGADTGLLRFDGLRFSSWRQMGGTEFPAARISDLYASPDGALWVALSQGGVYRIHNGEAKRIDGELFATASVNGIAGDSRGTVVVVTDTNVFERGRNGWARLSSGLPDDGILSAYFNNGGRLFIGTTQGLFGRVPDSQTFERLTPWWTFSVTETKDGQLWTTDIRMGFRRIEDDLTPLPMGNGYRIISDRHADLWVATIGQGLWRVRTQGKAASVAKLPGLLSDSVQVVLEDREGNIWAGTTGGLHRLSRRRLTPMDVGFVTVTEHTQNTAWIGTWSGLVTLTRRNADWVEEHHGFPDEFVRAVHEDSSAGLLVGSDKGLSRITREGSEVIPVPASESASIYAITSDRHRNIWVTNGQRLFRLVDDGLSIFDLPAEWQVRSITQLYGDREGRLWMTLDGGRRLAFLDKNDATCCVRIGASDSNGDSTINSVFQDRAGVFWIAHDQGLSSWTPEGQLTLDRQNGLPGDRVWAVIEDDNGALWLSMDFGVLRLPRPEVLTALTDDKHRIRYRLYDASDGLAGTAVRNVRVSRAPDGTLWFIRGGGLTVVDPRELTTSQFHQTGPVKIEAAATEEQTLAPAEGVVLPPGVKRLQITYTALNLTSPTKVRFRYRLDGFDADWVDGEARREVVYTNLPPGDYRFRVEATTIEGAWSESVAMWAFTLSPRFYQTRWFILLSLVCVVMVVVGAWRFRARIMTRQFAIVLAERTRLSQEIHDTLLQNLVGLAFQFDHLYSSVTPLEHAARERILEARRLIQAHIKEARHSIAELRSPSFDVDDLAKALRDFGKKATLDTTIRFEFSALGSPAHLSPGMRTQLLRIGQEAITNAVRHASSTYVSVKLVCEPTSVHLRVADDGEGFDTDAPVKEEHYGLLMMRERSEQVGGTVDIDSTRGGGTRVDVKVPLTRASAV